MISILKNIIKDFHVNPLPAFKQRSLCVPVDLGKIITITGPRRAGKTWYLFQLMDRLQSRDIKKEQILYLNFEDERLSFESSYDIFLNAYLELYPERQLNEIYIFFDEIQVLPNWEKYIRRIYDTVTRHIFLTGSNANMLSKEIATSLRGRSLSFEILPLSFPEFLSFRDIDCSDLNSTTNKAKIQNSFNEYLEWGGYPEIAVAQTRFKSEILQEYFNVMLYRDLMDRYEIKDSSIVRYLLKRLIDSFTKEFSVNKLYNDLKSRGLKIGKTTIYRLVDQIFSIYLAACIEKYDPAVVKREMSNKKIYLHDNGMASAIRYSFSKDRGKLLENLIFAAIRNKTEDIFFLKNGYECDFIVFPKNDNPSVIQVTETLNPDNLKRELKGLTKARELIPDSTPILITNSIQVQAGDLPDWIELKMTPEWLIQSLHGSI